MRLHNKNDKDLLRVLFEGEERVSHEAWKVFLDRYTKLFLKIIWQFEDEHDEAMEKYIYVCSKLAGNEFSLLKKYTPEKFENPPALSTYLTVVVRNLCVEQYRRTRRERLLRKKIISIEQDAAKEAESGQSGNGIISRIDEKLLIEKLNEEERKLYHMRYTEEQTAKEIGDTMKLSSRRVYYKLDKLAESIKEKLNL